MPLNIVNEYGVGYGIAGATTGIGHVGAQMIPQTQIPTAPNTKAAEKTLEEIKETIQPSAEEMANIEQKELWQREDEIRKETQEREDTAYQRSVSDMRKAGVNPNLQSISGASAGGGITSASQKNLARIENEKDRALKKAMQEIELNWSGTQKDLDRITSIIKEVL